jgi:5-methylcytosine-specific restriction endonuclease McrA
MNETQLLDFIGFVGDTMYLYGFYKRSINEQTAPSWSFQVRELGIYWIRNQRGVLRVYIDIEKSSLHFLTLSGYRPSNELVVGNTDIGIYNPDVFDELLADVAEINSLLRNIFHGIKLKTNYCYCQSSLHKPSSFPSICRLDNELWLCENCCERQKKIDEHDQQIRDEARTQLQIERDLMKASLRYQILKRDNYTCQACGRSPKTETGVKLHIDHIIPVSKGGKTEPDNLQTLCDLCNLGKAAG